MAREMSLGDPNQEKEEGGLTSVIEEDPLSKCALFVCNKWEQVPEQEVQSVKDETVTVKKPSGLALIPNHKSPTCQPLEL